MCSDTGTYYLIRGKYSRPNSKNTLETWLWKPILTAIDTPISISLADHLTLEEREQILQTVEMFKVVTQANPDDYQSLEILKEAYWKIGQQAEGLTVTRQLADTYMRLGQFSSAMLEYEGILLHEPDSADVQGILAELEEKLHPNKTGAAKTAIALDFGIEEPAMAAASVASPPAAGGGDSAAPQPATLITTAETRMPKVTVPQTAATLEDDGNEPLAKFLIQHRLASNEVVNRALQRVRTHNAELKATPDKPGVAAGLMEEIIAAGVDAETLLGAIIDRTKCAYVPLEFYDVDRQIVKVLPEHLTLGRRIVPFDIVSRTMMVAIDNPFDSVAKTLVQQSVDYHVQWHLAGPVIVHRVLRETYRIAE